ncbi:MAG: hypothetical protein IH630_02980 [Thermoplasmata archaeon]|nr:hypothetical protein [Thermoplasmata archaeon]TFG70412.1 MAG: hypothetical protein E4H25_02215 [Methanomassiliicoccus sp.]
MERKFESELAEKVSLRSKSGFFGRKASVFALAIISSAIMIGAAAVTLSMNASATEGAWNYKQIHSADDFLVYDLSEGTTFTDLIYVDAIEADDDFVVKRSSDLKAGTFDSPGWGPTYTKLVYSVNVKLRHTAPFEGQIGGLEIASLTVAGFDQIPVLGASTISLNGVVVPVSGILVNTVSDDGVTVDLVLPDLATIGDTYESYDMISFLVVLKVPQAPLDLTAVEIGFPSYNPVTDEELVTP